MKAGLIVIVITMLVLSSVTWVITTNNMLINAHEETNRLHAEIGNQYERRYTLIPRLVNATKLYINYETKLLTDITEARSQWGKALASGQNLENAASGLENVANRLMVLVTTENYPELKGDTLVIGLMDELAGTENRCSHARRNYNDAVISYNKQVRYFPNSLIAGMFGFQLRETFKINGNAWNAPQVVI